MRNQETSTLPDGFKAVKKTYTHEVLKLEIPSYIRSDSNEESSAYGSSRRRVVL